MRKKVTYFDTFASRGKDRIRNNPNHYLKISMMKNYLKNLKLLSLMGVVLVSAWWNVASAQNCTITGPAEVCAADPAAFTVNAQPGDVVVWSTSTGQTANGASAQFTHAAPGNITVTITVTITTPGGSTCTQNATLTVNDLPTSSFTLLSSPSQCYNGNNFCFQDNSTPGQGRSLVSVEFLFGDGAQDFTTGPGGTYCHGYPNQAGGYYTQFQRVINDKGCADDFSVPNGVYVMEDIDADFSTNATLACGQTIVPIQNNSRVPYARVKKFTWDFGDGESFTSGSDAALNLCYWSPTHVYTKHGCFNVTLTVEDDSGCVDVMFKSGFACNVNPQLVIEESNGKDAQCQTGNNFTFTHNIDPLSWPVNFLWIFDDPNSGPLNFNNRNFKGAQHSFTAPDIYTVTIQGTIAGCPFFSSIDVLTKGPAAAIDSKGKPDIVADSLRHQCQIKDTVYFKNNSAFAFNDIFIIDDIAPGAASVLKENNMVLVTATPSVRALEEVIDIFIWGTDTMAVIEKPLAEAAHTALIKHELVMFNNFFGSWGGQRQDDHTKTVWDFGDNTAPQCTSWMKYRQNIWDANGKWMNCNFSRDPKPKHWYTPGEEGCFTVRLTVTDTTYQVSGQGYQYYEVKYYDGIQKEWVLHDITIDTNQYNTFKRSSVPDPTTTRYSRGGVFNDTARFVEYMTLDSVFDFPPLMNGTDTVWNYNPYCAVEKTTYQRDNTPSKRFFAGMDTSFGKWYINPNHLNGNDCEATSQILLALEPPNASGMKVKPTKGVFCLGSNPTYGVNFDWSETTPSCTRQHVWMNFDSLLDRLDPTPTILDKWTPQAGFLLNPVTPWPLGTLSMPQYPNEIYYDYTGKLADSCGRITVGLRVQNGYDPFTKQPCIDEKWYHHMLNYINSDPEFTLDTVYGCSPLEVELTFIREYHDSLEALSINANVDFTLDNDFNKGFTYIDSIYRNKFDPRTGDTVNYILTFYVDRTGIAKKVDSVVWSPSDGGLVGCGSELKIKTKRKLTFREPGRYAVLATANTKDGCANTSSVHYIVVGFAKDVGQNKTLICKNEIIEFYDTALYLLLEPDPITGEQFIRYNYWRDGNRFQDPDGNNRTPTPRHETTNWDFGQGTGFTTIRFNPIPVSYNVPGHYFIRAEFMDSIGCRDTMFMEVDVTGGKANFNFTERVNLCKPIIDFFDSSVVYDPCRLTQGVGCDSVIRWIWDFGDGSPLTNTTIDNPVAPPIRNPSHLYDKFGDYDVTLIIETRMGCWDTLVRTVSIAGPQPKFDFTIDSIGCAPYTVYLGNFTIDPSPYAAWTWHFGDSAGTTITTDRDTVVYFTYTKPGKYKLKLIQGDTIPLTKEWCTAVYPDSGKVIEVTVLPEKTVDFIPSKREVCPDEIITFTDTSDSTYSTFVWDMGDGTIITLDESQGGRQITHKYALPGDYVVRLVPDYTPAPGEPKCRQSKALLIKVRDVNASFTVDTTGMPLFKFDDESTNAVEHWWRFGDGDEFTKCPTVDPVNCPNAQHNYGDKVGSFDVCLVVKSPEGCYDTACATIRNTFETSIYIPNVFTPDGDDFNDVFEVDIDGWVTYEIKIYNRFSEEVFQSTDPANPWNGKKDNTGADLPAGVYYVVITYQLRGQTEQTYNGTVTLIR